VNGETLMD